VTHIHGKPLMPYKVKSEKLASRKAKRAAQVAKAITTQRKMQRSTGKRFDDSHRDERFREYLRLQPCDVCFLSGRVQRSKTVVAHVVETQGHGAYDHGTCIPLCRHHELLGAQSYHVMGRLTFAAYHNIPLEARAIYWYQRYTVAVTNGDA